MKKHLLHYLRRCLALLGPALGIMKKYLLRFLGPCLALLVFGLALRLLYGIVKGYSLAEVVASVKQIPPGWIAAAVVMTVINYIILVGYDYLAVRYVGEPLGLGKIAFASFAGYACSYNIGATLAGTSIRCRLYSAWGMSPLRILQLLVILGLTFWFGVFALAGVIFVVDPPQVPLGNHAELVGQLHHAAHHTTDALVHNVLNWLSWLSQYMRPLGVVLLVLAVAYVALAATHDTLAARYEKIRRWNLPVPPFKLTVYQIAVAAADLLVAAWVLYMLMPRMREIDYPKFVGIYMVAYVLVVLSHVPGGLGVLEPAILLFLPHHYRLAGFAALIVFRVIYYWTPFLIAMVLLGMHEISLRKQWIRPPAESPSPQPPNNL